VKHRAAAEGKEGWCVCDPHRLPEGGTDAALSCTQAVVELLLFVLQAERGDDLSTAECLEKESSAVARSGGVIVNKL